MASWLLTTVWCLLLLGSTLAPRLGSEAALIVCYAACAALLLAARPCSPVSLAGAGLAAAAGFVALPGWLASIWGVGLLLGLPPVPHTSAVAAGASAWLAHVALAPLFEELLYRERLLPALRARIGAPLALALSSALFAAPHLEAWSVLTTFCVGLALGGVFLATGRVELCVAHHAGLNAAVLVCGLPPERAVLAPPLATLVGVALLMLACWWTRGRAARPAVHPALRAPHAPRPQQA
jgi:membrane protease YdiL (CAAX protease family)